jgi:hypothetical protein
MLAAKHLNVGRAPDWSPAAFRSNLLIKINLEVHGLEGVSGSIARIPLPDKARFPLQKGALYSGLLDEN